MMLLYYLLSVLYKIRIDLFLYAAIYQLYTLQIQKLKNYINIYV